MFDSNGSHAKTWFRYRNRRCANSLPHLYLGDNELSLVLNKIEDFVTTPNVICV